MAEFTVYAGSASGWDSSSNATGEPDSSFAYESNGSDGWKYLTLSNFNIPDNLPAGAIIDSLKVSALLKGNSGSSTDEMFAQVYARINGVDQTRSNASKLSPFASVRSITYTSGDSLNPDNLTNALFTARVAVEFVDMTMIKKAECDYVAVTVVYHLPSPVGLEMGCVF